MFKLILLLLAVLCIVDHTAASSIDDDVHSLLVNGVIDDHHVIINPHDPKPPKPNRFIQFWKRKQRFKWLLTFGLTLCLTFTLLFLAYTVVLLFPFILAQGGSIFSASIVMFGGTVNGVGVLTACSVFAMLLIVLINKTDISW